MHGEVNSIFLNFIGFIFSAVAVAPPSASSVKDFKYEVLI